MKQAVASIFFLLLLLPGKIMAQKCAPEIFVYRGWGSTLFNTGLTPSLRSNTPTSRELIGTTVQRETTRGTNGLDLHFPLNDRMAWGLGLGYLHAKQQVRLPDGRRPDHSIARFDVMERSIVIAASMRYDWNTGNIRVYSGAQAGTRRFDRWSYRNDLMDNVRQFLLVYHVTPFGLRFGGALAGHVELGYGHKGILVAGLSWSFHRSAPASVE